MSDLRKAAEQALNALEAMMAEFKALDLPYGSKAYALAKDARLDLRAALAKPTPLTSEEMSQWVKTTWKQCQDKAWEESHE